MTDKELIELAAKAAGIELSANGYRRIGTGVTGMPLLTPWNPLEDDGDALRLAVKLNIDLQFQKWSCRAFYADHCHDANRGVCEEQFGIDPYAATCRAVTRAAAEIGKAMA